MGRDRRIWMLVIAAVVIALDRVSKRWINAHLALGHAIPVFPKTLSAANTAKTFITFRITHVLNTGAAFSMFENMNEHTVRNLLVAFSIIAVIVVLALLWKVGKTFTMTSVALALILGGALGNLYDRVMYSHVVDFLEFHIARYHFPDFNIADSCIVIGACLLLLEMLLPQKHVD
jgi:signal peptidase II